MARVLRFFKGEWKVNHDLQMSLKDWFYVFIFLIVIVFYLKITERDFIEEGQGNPWGDMNK